MLTRVIVPLWLLLLSLLPIASARLAVWPQPTDVEIGEDVLWVDPALRATLYCGNESQQYSVASPSTLDTFLEGSQQSIFQALGSWQNVFGLAAKSQFSQHADPRSENQYLREAVRETLKSLHHSKFVPWKFHPRRSSFEPEASAQGRSLISLELTQTSCPSSSFEPSKYFDGDESYEIRLKSGTAFIEAKSTVGSLRALETFKQLFYAHSSGPVYTPHTPLHIRDSPFWKYRGLSLDIARNPFSADDVVRTIDAMASVKMNKLHVHATDSQSWPLEIPALPELAAKGAYQPDLVWRVDDLSYVQNYGASKGVQVFLELDMPGHTASVANAHPELIAAYNQLDWSTFAAEPLSGQFKLNSTQVYDFLDTLFDDLLPRQSPYTSIYHLGGDEVNLQVHTLDETVESNKHEVLQPLIQKLMQGIYDKVVDQGLRPMVWEEMVLEWGLDFSSGKHGLQGPKPLVQAWISSEHIVQLLEKGFPVIFGDSGHWYLDCGFGQFLDPYPSGKSPVGVPFNSSGGVPSRLEAPYLDYCGPYHNWRSMYMFDPLQGIPEHLHAGIEGGETLMWSEQTDGIDLDFKLWPRAAAAAEVLWAGPRQESMIADATWRLGQWRERGVSDLKISASPVQMTWCLMEGATGGCQY
ncbi:uncharacterized protein HMPREF1541_06066 [Cyphellophora europaea CBS 101466]|uniref:Beta-hexosaminidase n=1 Tax=Cyphellophora europaea (strain CBS 101466) TaxID=1220924 RepID=W2RU53_CYPE1|nr:uncharacterized protein HMPREF1541_06066 [Cyphellophora europaea CBS 101466]ETN39840.1 hypothetical protein HMPREF1541_06066 [Cyphellophora europaea CBS 101466]